MLKREERAVQATMWVEHLRGWQGCGDSLAAYARGHGLQAEDAYRWKGILRRSGTWVDAATARPGRAHARALRSAQLPVRFARVEVSDAAVEAPTAAAMILRLVLANGRRAELELTNVGQLRQVVAALERAA